MANEQPTSTDPQTFAIIGAAIEVHRQLGNGFLEPVYREAMRLELAARAIPFHAEVQLPIFFKGRRLATSYRADLVCYDQVIVELKALRSVGGPEEAQVLNYLKASGLERALLLNFGSPSLEYRRLIRSIPRHISPA
jgi:GxxExxY protein